MTKRVLAVLGGALLVTAVCSAWITGRMTGGGSIFQGDVRITHGFELHCGVNDAGTIVPGPNNLEVNWEGNHFHLESMIFSVCTTDDGFSARPPAAPFTTLDAAGMGIYNNGESCRASWRFTDYGEPGVNDLIVRLGIVCPIAGSVLNVTTPTKLTFGNHQAHK
jgi:hypothetical protein